MRHMEQDAKLHLGKYVHEKFSIFFKNNFLNLQLFLTLLIRLLKEYITSKHIAIQSLWNRVNLRMTIWLNFLL
jgi:hypothetical protein